MSFQNLSRSEKWILAGIPVLFFAGTLLHFFYDFTGGSTLAALFAPVNESVWEHAKMIVWPVTLWWWLYACFSGKQYVADTEKWAAGSLFALITALILMPLIYYFYTEAFGTELLWVDILILFLCFLSGQLAGLHTYRYGNGIYPLLVLIVFAAVILIFAWFTFFPPRIPWFQDPVSGSYGI